MKEITSLKNDLIKQTKKLHQKKARTQQQAYLLEGFHLIEEAVKSGVELKEIFVSERGLKEWQSWIEKQDPELFYQVTPEIMKVLSDQPSPQGIIATAIINETSMTDFSGGWLLLDNVQDPGNVGTMIRTADAAGLSGVILGSGSADPYNLKTLRSMQGSQFHLPIFQMSLEEALIHFKKQQTPIYGTALDPKAVNFKTIPPVENFALIMGNEGQGVAKKYLDQTDSNLYIPITGQAESLNVGVAAGILMYHLMGSVNC